MTKRRKQPDMDGRQLALDGLYVVPQPPAPVPGSLDYAAELCGVLSDAIARARVEHGLSREVIAARMSELTGITISRAMLDACTAESKDGHRFPFEWAAAFEAATHSNDLQLLLARKRGSLVLQGREAMDAQLGQVRRSIAAMKARERSLMRAVGDADA